MTGHARWLGWLWLAVMLAALGVGCKTADNENLSSRPWNAPRGFDTGIPGFDQYQRR